MCSFVDKNKWKLLSFSSLKHLLDACSSLQIMTVWIFRAWTLKIGTHVGKFLECRMCIFYSYILDVSFEIFVKAGVCASAIRSQTIRKTQISCTNTCEQSQFLTNEVHITKRQYIVVAICVYVRVYWRTGFWH